MSGRASLQWYFGEEARLFEQEVWPRLPEPTTARLRRFGSIALRLAFAGGLLAVVALLTRDYFVREEARMRRLLVQSVEAEALAWHQQDYQRVAERLDPEARPDWVRWYDQYQLARRNWAGDNARLPDVQIGEIEFLGRGRALVEVKLLSPDVPEELRYREWRLYRNISGDWLRTSTDENLWGAPQVLETGSFRFEFRQRDAAAVQAVAARAEAIYQQLHAALGLAYQPESSPLVVQVQAENVGVGPARFGGRRVVLLSPALQRARLGAEDSAVLSEGLTKALTERVAAQAAARTPFDARWAIVYEATKRWLAREADPFRRGNRVDEIGALAYQMQLNRQPTLWQLHERRTVYYWQAGWTLTSAEVLVEYLLGEGRHTDPQGIFRAMAAHTRWDEFAQAAAGMSAAELEKAWHAYLLRQYQLR